MASDTVGKNPFRILALTLVFLVLRTAVAQVAPLPPWTVLGQESSAVVVGQVVEGNLWVIDPEKRARAEVTPDGKPTLPNPSLFVIGILSRVRVKEVIKGATETKVGSTVNIFVPGYFASHAPHFLTKGEECVLFLRPLGSNDKQFVRATVALPGTFAYPSKQPRFDPKECYTPVREGYAQVILRPGRMKVLDEIKQALAKRPPQPPVGG